MAASFAGKYLGGLKSSGQLFAATLKTLALGHILWEYFYEPAAGWGASMLPTFHVVGDQMITDKRYKLGRGIRVGDIISFNSVYEPGGKVIKRVIGLEGDYVMRDTPEAGSTAMIQVPRGHCWVVGDNMNDSLDSRHWGPLPMALIRGKVIKKVLPWSERKWIENGLHEVD